MATPIRANRRKALWVAVLLIVIITLMKERIVPHYSLGLLYLLPILLASVFLKRWQILALALLCTVLREMLGFSTWDYQLAPRFLLALLAFGAAGLLVAELSQHRQLALEHLKQLEAHVERREIAQEQLQGVIESSPAAILTVDAEGTVLLANEAAHELLGCQSGSLPRDSIDQYLPTFATLRRTGRVRSLRTMMECSGRRRDGQVFLAHAWLSSYQTRSGPHTAVIIFDATEQLRDRGEEGLHQLLANSRIVMGAVWHELRNLNGAIRVVLGNLERVPALRANTDFQALGTLVEGLGKLASAELYPTSAYALDNVDLPLLLSELRIVVDPLFREATVTVEWNVPQQLPLVRANHQGLLQVFLNLAKNAQRACVRSAAPRTFTLSAGVEGAGVVVRFLNSGSGIPEPARLFQPFQFGSSAVGLGLYVSRAIMRSFAGDLRYEPVPQGCCFAAVLEVASG